MSPSAPRWPSAFLVLLVALGACRRQHEPLDAAKEILATLPATYRRGSVAVARDGRTVAWIDARADGMRVVAGGIEGPPWADVLTPKPAPRGGLVGYWATDTKAVEPPPVSLVVGGPPVRTGFVRPGVLVFAPDGKRWAAAGGLVDPSGPDRRGPVAVLVDGREAGRFADTSAPAFSPDGRHVAWLAEQDGGGLAVVVDGTVRREIAQAVPDVSPAMKLQNAGPTLGPHMLIQWMADASLLVLAPGPDGWALTRDDRRLGVWPQARLERSGNVAFDFGDRFAEAPAIASASVSAAELAPVVAWWERLPGAAERWRVARDGSAVDDVVCQSYLASQPPPTLSPDGAHVAYGCRLHADDTSPQTVVVRDGERFGPYWGVYGVAVADDGTVAYAATDDAPTVFPRMWRYRVEGRPRGPRVQEAWRPRLDPAGERLAWEATPEKASYLGLDATPVSRFDEVYWGPEFVAPQQVAWVVRRGRKIARITLRF